MCWRKLIESHFEREKLIKEEEARRVELEARIKVLKNEKKADPKGSYDKKEPKPIAFKKSGTDEIYDINLDTRIDLKAVQRRNQQK